MEKGHLALFFLIVSGYCFIGIYAERERYLDITEEKQRIEESLLYAISASAWEMTEMMEESEQMKLYTLKESFFRAWYVRLGLSDNIQEQEKIRMYLPLMVWLEEDGGYFYYMEEINENGVRRLSEKWSACMPYTLSGDINEDKAFLTEYLEQKVSEMISEHNRIAKSMGMEYEFSVPHFLAKQETLQFPIFIVVFQGWPLEGSGKVLYENCMDANAFIKRKE